MNELEFEGNSGCKIELINDTTIRKYSSSTDYNVRLHKQFNKQNMFIPTDVISSPQVSHIQLEEGLLRGEMDFILGQSFIQYFQLENLKTIKNTFVHLVNYIQKAIDKSSINVIDKDLFKKKFKSLNITDYTTSFISVEYPVNVCHGDLTLSNIIFKNNKIYLIDFLDSFIETPYQDIIKLRQDTLFKWSLLKLKNKNFDRNKISQVLYYLNDMITDSFYDHIKLASFKQLEKMNYLRILPYCTVDETRNFIYDTLKELDK